MKKRFFSAITSVALLANMTAILPASVAFAEDTTSRTYSYDGYDVLYEVSNSWGNTEVVSVTLTNTGSSAIENWMLYFDPNGDIQYVSDATQKTTESGYSYIKNAGYNAEIAVDSSVSFSYAVNDCNEEEDEGYVISFSQALVNLIENNIEKEGQQSE